MNFSFLDAPEDVIHFAFKEARKNIDKNSGIPRDTLFSLLKQDELEFYALYQQSTIGDINTIQPPFYLYNERTKWFAWKNLGNMSRTTAKSKYLHKLVIYCIDPTLSDNFWSDFIKKVEDFRLEYIQSKRQEKMFDDGTAKLPLDLPVGILELSDITTFAPLTFINPQEEERIVKHSIKLQDDLKREGNGKEIVTIGDLKQRCNEMEELILYEIRLLKYSLRESMRRITELEHQTLIGPHESDNDMNDKLQTMLESNETSNDVKKVITNVQNVYHMVTLRMKNTQIEIDKQNAFVQEATCAVNRFMGHKSNILPNLNAYKLSTTLDHMYKRQRISWWLTVTSFLSLFGLLEFVLYKIFTVG
jgi:acyl-CoA-binding protein